MSEIFILTSKQTNKESIVFSFPMIMAAHLATEKGRKRDNVEHGKHGDLKPAIGCCLEHEKAVNNKTKKK